MKLIAIFLFFISIINVYSNQPQKVIIIDRFEFGDWACSQEIRFSQDTVFYDNCKWSNKSKCVVIRDSSIHNFLSNLSVCDIKKMDHFMPEKNNECGITKIGYAIYVMINDTIVIKSEFCEFLNCKKIPNNKINELKTIFSKSKKIAESSHPVPSNRKMK